ncbi:DUF2125 domain-containing protein [Boseongicola aestuarii]|uniref:DUF2125 domain-containing protein n=1 Tax=Boseongicola aestuarii TaxID=1470561 RepID=A0A238IY38_9RHOB|nr:DUF2125 domain-containing protein [Boseongicola aestuarii]SMX22951.1 hypothetical protein BOA8489_01050 [Boseongicola aestuarii]
MGRLIVVVLVASLGWMAWWAFGSSALDRALTAWVDERRSEGWAADVADIDVAGFPNRFDTTLSDIRFADPETGVAWSAPFLQLLALAYKPHQVIAVLPNEHRLSTPLQTLDLSHDQARGSIFMQPSPSLPLDRSTIIIEALSVGSTLGWTARLDEGRFATEQIPARANAHRIGAELLGFHPPQEVLAILDPAGLLPRTVERMRFDADIGFTAPWDRGAIEIARPQIVRIDLNDLSAEWGSVTFRAAGALDVDARGTPTGEISIKAVDWRRLLQMFVASGMVGENVAPTIETALEFLAALKGPSDTIDADLSLRSGRVFLGPIPLGDAPKIVIR